MTRLEEVQTFTKNISKTTAWLLAVLTAVTVGLLVASFIVPPTGVIDPSVLKAAGEIFAFGTLWVVREAIKEGLSVKATHGNTTIEVGREEEEKKKTEAAATDE